MTQELPSPTFRKAAALKGPKTLSRPYQPCFTDANQEASRCCTNGHPTPWSCTNIPPSHSPPGLLLVSSHQEVPGGGHRLCWTSFQPGLPQILPGRTSLSQVLGCISEHWGQVLLADRKTRQMFKMETPPPRSPPTHPPPAEASTQIWPASARNSNLIYMLRPQQEPRPLLPGPSLCHQPAPPSTHPAYVQGSWLATAHR